MSLGKTGNILKTITKYGIFGGCVYYVTANGFWSNNKEYPSIKAWQDLNQKADNVLGGKYLSQVSMPEARLSDRWDRGVAKSMDFLADLPITVSSKCQDGLEYIHKKLD